MPARDAAADKVDLMTMETARLYLPSIDENYQIISGVSALVIGSCIQAYTKVKYTGVNSEHARTVGLGLGWWDAMIGRGVPEWITTLAQQSCLLDMHPDSQIEFIDKMRGLISDNANELWEIVPLARALYLYLGWDYDIDDILKAIHEHDNPIIDSWSRAEELKDLSLM